MSSNHDKTKDENVTPSYLKNGKIFLVSGL